MNAGLYTRLAAARKAFQERADFSKVMTDELKYAYLPIEQAKPVIEAVTAEQEITIIPISYRVIEGEEYTYHYMREKTYPSGYVSQTKWFYQTAEVTFLIASPDGEIEIPILAEAQDSSDKCVSKLYTAAYKNLVKILFGFAESSKDDADASQGDTIIEERAPKTREDMEQGARQNIKKHNLIQEVTKLPADRLYDILTAHGYEGQANMDEMRSALRLSTINTLERILSEVSA